MTQEIFPSSVSVIGSTGSVGTQAMEIVAENKIAVDLLSADRNVALAEEQIRRFSPRRFVMVSEKAAADLRVRVADTQTVITSTAEGLDEAILSSTAPVLIHSVLGEAGLRPTMAAIRAGKRIGLANKECLVIAGDLVKRSLANSSAQIVPVDSEHSAIFQCLAAGRGSEVASLMLTASGGPFRGYTAEMLREVTREKALAHPTWRMGAKITVDSATLMNKGFEVIEAVRLFDVPVDRVRVVVHPESIIHSAVEYIDSAVIAQMSLPDMRLCIQYAMTYPHRAQGLTGRLSLPGIGKLTFQEPDTEVFPLLASAYSAIRKGGAAPAVLNAANEVAVAAFLEGRLPFYAIAETVIETVETFTELGADTLEERIAADRSARRIANEKISNRRVSAPR